MNDITVVGGGPAGSKAAALLSGYDVCVIEEHAVSGRPMQCTGLVSDDVIRLSGIKVDILNSLYGANVHFPDGTRISVRTKERKAVLMDRGEFDSGMAAKAQDSGAQFLYNVRYLGHRVRDGGVDLTTGTGGMRTKLLIGADGYRSSVAASIPGNGPREYVRGLQMDIAQDRGDEDMIDIYVGSEYAPGFFAWAIPFDGKVRVGLCSSCHALPPSEYLRNVMRRAGISGSVVEKHCGMIPLGGRRRTYGDNLMLIGDAAGQVKPVSGGGLFPALVSSYCLKETAEEAMENDRTDGSFLRVYERRWKARIGKELRRGYRLRRLYAGMDDDDLNDASRVLSREDAKRMLNSMEIDRPSDLAAAMMRVPGIAVRALPIMFRTLFR